MLPHGVSRLAPPALFAGSASKDLVVLSRHSRWPGIWASINSSVCRPCKQSIGGVAQVFWTRSAPWTPIRNLVCRLCKQGLGGIAQVLWTEWWCRVSYLPPYISKAQWPESHPWQIPPPHSLLACVLTHVRGGDPSTWVPCKDDRQLSSLLGKPPSFLPHQPHPTPVPCR